MAFVASSSVALRKSIQSMDFLTRLPSPHQHHVGTAISVPVAKSKRVASITMAAPERSTVADTPQKEFLERLKSLGKVRIVVRNEVGILESVGTFDSLFYATIPSGEYANLIDLKSNLDMHILLSGLTGVRFEIGVSRSKSRAPLYTLRLLGKDKKSPAASVFVMWDRDADDIEPERIQAWKDLKSDYVKDEDAETFFFNQ